MRIPGIDDKNFPLSLRPLAYLIKRRFGKLLKPYRAWAYRPAITWMFALFMTSIEASTIVDSGIKRLVSLRVAQLIGCVF